MSNVGSLLIRRSTHMKSLFLEYPRNEGQVDLWADLFNFHKVDMKIDLPILTADANGIEIKFPSWLTGIFYLKIQDGEKAFLERISIQ